ncbi:MAG: ParB N-terminal domain-containing protein [Cypionkella sp.]
MAKRKRLTLPGEVPPALSAQPGAEAPALFPLGVSRSATPNPAPTMAPIARVAGEASALAALSDLAGEMAAARDTGRMIQSLALDVVDADYLVRDRMVADEAELEVLMQSLRARGQQVPIEVAALPPNSHGDRYGLISGWRRLSALRRLRTEAPDDPRFARVLAILRRPEVASEAYLAMVEENEIRVGLSYYERARIVARAAEQGVFPDTSTALAQLFAAASRAKRSKIGSFLRIVAALDDRLRFAANIPERLGLSLSRALEADPAFAPRLRDRLRKTPAETAEAELAALEKSLLPSKPFAAKSTPEPVPAPIMKPVSQPAASPARPLIGAQEMPDLFVETGVGFVTLRGPKVTVDFQMQLLDLLRQMRD